MRTARPRLRAGSTWAALLALIGSLAVGVAAAGPALAEEVHVRPADGVFPLEGRGFGHGRGMSQWGAQGAASRGVSADAILAAYYPGTARTVLPDSSIRVQLAGDEGRDTVVLPAAGLTVTDVATGATATLPSGPARWRVAVVGGALQVQSLSGSSWAPFAVGGRTSSPGPVRFGGPTFTRVVFPDGSSRDYRGVVQAVRTSSTALATVVVLSLEDYLLGVVPREAPSSWHAAALQAQAVAARSYSVFKRDRAAAGAAWDICDTTSCQVFGGSASYTAAGARTNLEPASTTAAVQATRGVVRTYGGKAIFAEFSSANGGWSSKGDFPYLVAQRDDWDGIATNNVHSWTGALRATDLERRFPAVGTLRRIRVVTRDGNGPLGGRVRQVVLEGVSSSGAATSVTTTGESVRFARPWPTNSDGLKSSWWRMTSGTAPAPAPAPAPTATATTAPAPVPGPPALQARHRYGAYKGVGPRVIGGDPRLVDR